MGSWSSKPARKLGKETTSSIPLRQGSELSSRPPPPPQRRPTYGDLQGNQHTRTTGARGQEACESKTQAVKDDGRDPHLLANLQRIGQVQVPRGKVKFQPSNEMLNILQARRRDSDAEQEASQAAQAASGGVRVSGQIRNRMGASVLVSLLDERKTCQSRKDLEELAHAYDIDVSVMETLARFVNAPSIAAGSRLRAQNERKDVVEPNDDAPPRIDAIWTEPNLQNFKEIPGKSS